MTRAAAEPVTKKAQRIPALPEGTRARLLEAAGQVFGEAGYRAATVREICARAGVNAALVNYHFGDKLELYTELLRSSILEAKGEILPPEGAAQGTPEETLRRVVHAMLQRICAPDRPAWRFRIMVHELANPSPALDGVIEEGMRPIHDRFRALIGRILDLPLDHEKTRLSTHSILAQVVYYSHSRHVLARMWPELTMTPERVAAIADHITDFSLAGLHAAGSSPEAPHATAASPKRKK